MTISFSGLNLKIVFVLVLLAATGSVLFLSKVRRREIVRFGRQKRVIASTKNANVHVHKFNMRGNDVMVFLHIQKTGGSNFGIQLVRNLDIERPCKCSRSKKVLNQRGKPARVCRCFRPNSSKIWLFSRHHLGWPCGLHADWTEHKECVAKYMNKREGTNKRRKFFYVTIIREPVARFLSEFSFVRNTGSTWSGATLRCDGRSPTEEELPSCFVDKNLSDLTLDEFRECPWNLAINRQTRMLADLRLVNCYDASGMSAAKRSKIMLRSAMRNLQEMMYFGLVEYQQQSQYLFEKTFGLKFFTRFTQVPESETNVGKLLPNLNSSVLGEIGILNSLDVQLYDFAKNLFFERIRYFEEADRIKIGETPNN